MPLSAFSAFQAERLIASGDLADVAITLKNANSSSGYLLIDNETGQSVDLDLRGTDQEIRERYAVSSAADEAVRRGPGRPKLGVVAREVTLLPRHWDWLGRQPGGASVALRKLVENASRDGSGEERARRAREAANRFMHATAGDRPGYEEALRALYRRDEETFFAAMQAWPEAIRTHAARMAAPSFAACPMPPPDEGFQQQ